MCFEKQMSSPIDNGNISVVYILPQVSETFQGDEA